MRFDLAPVMEEWKLLLKDLENTVDCRMLGMSGIEYIENILYYWLEQTKPTLCIDR